MPGRFGKFELDEERRELRLNGEEIPLQPRVFDLLVLLYRNRNRVMSKDELLDELWPGVVVGDGSLQRAVSLVRSALKRGGLENAVRNYARQGYRLCLHGDPDPEALDHVDAAVESAREAFSKGHWDAAIDAYRRADASQPLDATGLEQLADACQCSGRAADAEPVWERAAALYSAEGNCLGAARSALRLAEIAFEAARLSVAQGWLTRGRRYLGRTEEGWEHGLEAYVAARIATLKAEPEIAREHARRGLEIGQRLGSDEIEAINRICLGYAELMLGNVHEGIALVDEAAAAALAGNVGLRAGGIVYCGLISVCCNRGDWERAAQWSDGFSRWCARSGMARFSGLCQLHRAEVLSVTGDGAEAEEEIREASKQLAAYSPFAEGESFRILGDLLLMRGELDAAEAAFRRAHELGWDPQPGLAMLQSERGDAVSAIRGLVHSLDDRNWALRQRRGLLLAQLVIIAAQNEERDLARQIMSELERHTELWVSDFHGGAVARARAELALLEGKPGEAFAALREATRNWQAARAGLHQAACRFRLAQLLAQERDSAGALLELDAAQSVFESMRAPARVEACRALRESLQSPDQRL